MRVGCAPGRIGHLARPVWVPVGKKSIGFMLWSLLHLPGPGAFDGTGGEGPGLAWGVCGPAAAVYEARPGG